MLSIVKSMSLHGLEGVLIDVEVDISSGMPCWDIVGLPDTNIRESKERVRTAIKNCGIELLSRKYIINLSPATIKKDGAILDLAIAVGILKSMNVIHEIDLSNVIFIGELSLNGNLNRVNGILPICIEAKKNGIKKIILPLQNAEEASIIDGIDVIGIQNLKEVINYLNRAKSILPTKVDVSNILNKNRVDNIDFSEVKGQEFVKRALEIAAAGGHNCLMIGAPGCGKTMMAKRMTTILPDLTFEEALEITKIHSIAGLLNDKFLICTRPFRSPHHSITEKALIGGGKIPKPGEISLSHLGILFLDEFLEFNKKTIEILRIPIEDRKINISRVGMNIMYPANFMLIASMNPCPCGYYGSAIKECVCTEQQRSNYLSKISGPILDRFDMHIQVPTINCKNMNEVKAESSEQIRGRVNKARYIQQQRYKNDMIYFNADLSPKMIEKYCTLHKEESDYLNSSVEKLKLSARAYSRILKVARTIADLDNMPNIEKIHLLEAMQYRNLDKL